MKPFSTNKYKPSNFEIKRLTIFKFLSRVLSKYGDIKDKSKFKNKEALFSYISLKFSISRSQSKRLIKKFATINSKNDILKFIKHQNSFNIPHNKTTDLIVQKIINDFKKYYEESNTIDKSGNEVFIPFTLKDFYYSFEYQQSYNCIRTILIKHNLVWHFAYKSTKKLIKQNLKINNSNICEDFLKMVNQALNYKLSQHSKQIKKQRLFGEVVEIDGCIHDWIPKIGKCNILATVDSSTGMMLSASLDWQETNDSYAEAIIRLVNKYGLPKQIYGDKRKSIFSDGINQTKITRPLTNLGVIVKCESYPEHKPNVEGNWKLLQQILPNYLHRKNINTFSEFKYFVENKLCDWFNARFNRKIDTIDVFKKVNPDLFKNNFCVAETRKVRVGNYIEIRNGYYAPFNDKNQRIVMKENGYINVYENLLPNESKDLFVKRGSQKYYLKPIDILIDTINWDWLKIDSPLNDQDELIINLKDEICTLKEENERLKLICYESGIQS